LYLTQISQTLESSNSHEAQKTWNITKLRKLIKKLKAQESQVVTIGWRKIERPNFLHKRNKWTPSDCSIKMDGVTTHCYERAPTNFNRFQP
jgi:hypothetical protein